MANVNQKTKASLGRSGRGSRSGTRASRDYGSPTDHGRRSTGRGPRQVDAVVAVEVIRDARDLGVAPFLVEGRGLEDEGVEEGPFRAESVGFRFDLAEDARAKADAPVRFVDPEEFDREAIVLERAVGPADDRALGVPRGDGEGSPAARSEEGLVVPDQAFDDVSRALCGSGSTATAAFFMVLF